jgi:hypothetical protein
MSFVFPIVIFNPADSRPIGPRSVDVRPAAQSVIHRPLIGSRFARATSCRTR